MEYWRVVKSYPTSNYYSNTPMLQHSRFDENENDSSDRLAFFAIINPAVFDGIDDAGG